MAMLAHLAVLTLTILALARFYSGVRIRSTGTAVVVAVVFSVLNFLLGWFIRALLFVPALLTFGLLFLFVPFIVNAVLLWLTDRALSSFELRTTRALWLSAAVITIVNGIFEARMLASTWHDAGYAGRWV